MIRRTAFCVVVDDAPGEVAWPEPTPDRLGFTSRSTVEWRSVDGRVHASGWAEGGDHEAPWRVDGDGFSVVAGDAIAPGVGWSPPSKVAERLQRTVDAGALVAQARGTFATARLQQGGGGFVANDPLGMRPLYCTRADGRFVVATRARLAAELLGVDDPRRDPSTSAWLAHATYPIGPATGFSRVEVLRPGEHVALRPTEPPEVRSGWPLAPPAHMADLDEAGLVDLVADDLVARLRELLQQPAPRVVLRLTGGKDSRLLLAVAMLAGVEHDLEYETIGPPDLADVLVARELADRFGLRHTDRWQEPGARAPYAERMEAFVARSGGMVNLWDAEPEVEPVDQLTLTGAFGELLRSPQPLPGGIDGVPALEEHLTARPLGQLGLVNPDRVADLDERLRAAVRDPWCASEDPRDRNDAFYIANRMRLLRGGPRLELARQHRAAPLYSIDAVRAAYALPSAARHEEAMHFEVIRRASPGLAAHRLVGPGWHPRHLDKLPSAPSSAAEGRGVKPQTVMQAIHGDAPFERLAYFGDVLARARAAAWDVLDRAACTEALERFATLPPRHRRELTGAVTAAAWLSG